MEPFYPNDQSGPNNGNGKSKNGLTRNGKSNNEVSYPPNPYSSNPGELGQTSGPEQTTPELIPVFEDQGERFDKARKSAMKVYFVLIIIGVIIGGISLFGIAMLLQHFNLTDVPVPVEQK